MKTIPQELFDLACFFLGDDVVSALRQADISLPEILKMAAIRSFLARAGECPQVEDLRQELLWLEKHGSFFFSTHSSKSA